MGRSGMLSLALKIQVSQTRLVREVDEFDTLLLQA
jgi:hypothetical protein